MVGEVLQGGNEQPRERNKENKRDRHRRSLAVGSEGAAGH